MSEATSLDPPPTLVEESLSRDGFHTGHIVEELEEIYRNRTWVPHTHTRLLLVGMFFFLLVL